MLRTNLSTRPFYNERAVYWILALAAVAIAALTVFNVTRVLALSAEQASLAAEIERDESRARALTTQATRVRSSIDRHALEGVILAAREANAVIDERTFSWTELFNRIESTLPPNVMLTAVQPKIDPKIGMTVSMVVLGREVEQVDAFIEKLESTGAFAHAFATTERITDEGLYEVALTADYHPSANPKASPVESSDSDEEPAAGQDEQEKPAKKDDDNTADKPVVPSSDARAPAKAAAGNPSKRTGASS